MSRDEKSIWNEGSEAQASKGGCRDGVGRGNEWFAAGKRKEHLRLQKLF